MSLYERAMSCSGNKTIEFNVQNKYKTSDKNKQRPDLGPINLIMVSMPLALVSHHVQKY